MQQYVQTRTFSGIWCLFLIKCYSIPERHYRNESDRGVAPGGRPGVRGLGAHGLAGLRQRDGLPRLLALRAVPRRQQQPPLPILPEMLHGKL